MKKKSIALGLTLAMLVSLTACGSKNNNANNGNNAAEDTTKVEFSVGMVTNVGGVNDQSFNQSAWAGLKNLRDNYGVNVSYLESNQESDYPTNLDKMLDNGNDLIWSVGFAMSSAAKNAALTNMDQNYGIIDETYGDETPENMVCVMFRAQESSFLAGYVAGLTTKTDKVGFVGGIGSDIIDQFEYGYRAGVDYAAKELGKEITVSIQYAETFTDAAKGKAIATKMFNEGCDIIFHAAGSSGNGVIEAAKDSGNWVIGVDMDQYYLSPEAVLTSAVKRVDTVIELVSAEYLNGNNLGGTTLEYGLEDGAVGLPEENPNLDEAVYAKAMEVKEAIIKGDVTVPYNAETFATYLGQ